MPYVKIKEEDINPVASFDTIQNAVLIFGFDFNHAYDDIRDDENLYDQYTGEVIPIENRINLPLKHKVYTSLSSFLADIKNKPATNSIDSTAYRPYRLAVDCLTNGLPVIYCPIDNYLDLMNPVDQAEEGGDGSAYNGANAIIFNESYSSEGISYDSIKEDFIFYEFLSDGDYIPEPKYLKIDSEYGDARLAESEGPADEPGVDPTWYLPTGNSEIYIFSEGYYLRIQPGEWSEPGHIDSESSECHWEPDAGGSEWVCPYVPSEGWIEPVYEWVPTEWDDPAHWVSNYIYDKTYNETNNKLYIGKGRYDKDGNPYNVNNPLIPAGPQASMIYSQFSINDSLAEMALCNCLKNPKLLFTDRINLPYSFITTCGYEEKFGVFGNTNLLVDQILEKTKDRLDFVYLYDLPSDMSPEAILDDQLYYNTLRVPSVKPEVVATIHPWCHILSPTSAKVLHVPGSYAYLMAYAESIKNNKPWLAVAGVHRGIIPNIRAVDWDFSEPYVHAFQGDDTADVEYILSDADRDLIRMRINPIVNFGAGFGNLIFGNRTYFLPNAGDADLVSFRSFLNVRLLLLNIHKAAFASSIQHTFEPNDDIVWLSFKQRVNDLLDQMVSGRGIKWYKWYKLQADKLGQIKAKLTIRPIEAVESFDITISMTDDDEIVVQEG